MENEETQMGSYRSSPLAASPGAVVWGTLLGLLYAVLVGGFFIAVFEADSVTAGQSLLSVAIALLSETWFQMAVGVGFLVPALAVVVLSIQGFRTRRYVLSDSTLTEKRGLFPDKEQTIGYDDIESMEFDQSFVQSQYGVGTIRINENSDTDSDEIEQIRAKYVQNAETFYSDLRSQVVEKTDTPVEAPPLREQGGNISSLSGDQLAADTSSSYLMPQEVVHPVPHYGALYGGLIAFVQLLFVSWFAFVFLGVASVNPSLRSTISSIFQPSLIVLFYAGAFLVEVGYNYWKYETIQYELFPDHVKRAVSDEKTTTEFDDVSEVTIREITGARWFGREVGDVILQADDDDELLALKYVENPDAVKETLDTLLANESKQ